MLQASKLKYCFSLILILSLFNAFAQDNYSCKEFYLKCKTDSSSIWNIHEKSGGFQVLPGDTFEIDLEILKGKDYQITLCGNDFIGNIFRLKILDKAGNILYDNENDNFAQTFSFSCLETKTIKFEIIIPETSSNTPGCLGVLFEEALSLPTGF